MTRLETDRYEYAYLKAIVLFSPGESARIALTIRVLNYTSNERSSYKEEEIDYSE